MTRSKILALTLLLVAVAIVGGKPRAVAAPIEVRDLIAQLSQNSGREITVTGRFRSYNGRRARLIGSDLDFELPAGTRSLRAAGKNLELTGSLARRGDTWFFKVQRFLIVPGEVEQFASRRARIANGDFTALVTLSNWARQHAEFYGDATLAQLSAEAHQQALAWEEDALARAGKSADLLAFATRREIEQAPDDELARLRHRALWLDVARLDAAELSAFEPLALSIRKLLPGTEQPAAELAAERRTEYLARPVDVYRDTPLDQRPVWHRVLWAEVVARQLTRQAAAPQAELAALVARGQALIPDRPEAIGSLRLADARHRAAHAERLGRSQVVALRQTFRDLSLPDEGEQILERWLAALRGRTPADDTDGWLRLADDYRRLANDEPAATQIYRDLLSRNAATADAEQGLRELGYQKLSGRWVRTRDLSASEVQQRRQDNAAEVEIGDPEAEVIRLLRRPDRIARVLCATETSEQWIYDGPPALVIELRRGRGPAHVTAIRAP